MKTKKNMKEVGLIQKREGEKGPKDWFPIGETTDVPRRRTHREGGERQVRLTKDRFENTVDHDE